MSNYRETKPYYPEPAAQDAPVPQAQPFPLSDGMYPTVSEDLAKKLKKLKKASAAAQEDTQEELCRLQCAVQTLHSQVRDLKEILLLFVQDVYSPSDSAFGLTKLQQRRMIASISNSNDAFDDQDRYPIGRGKKHKKWK